MYVHRQTLYAGTRILYAGLHFMSILRVYICNIPAMKIPPNQHEIPKMQQCPCCTGSS